MERPVKLLIVDDENQILETYKTFFQKRGLEVQTASNGEQGLRMLQHDDFDVAVVDIQMPKLDGISLAERVRKDGLDASIIILTGHGDKEDAIRAINVSVDAWFEKASIKMDELFAKVIELAQVISLDDIRHILSSVPISEGLGTNA